MRASPNSWAFREVPANSIARYRPPLLPRILASALARCDTCAWHHLNLWRLQPFGTSKRISAREIRICKCGLAQLACVVAIEMARVRHFVPRPVREEAVIAAFDPT